MYKWVDAQLFLETQYIPVKFFHLNFMDEDVRVGNQYRAIDDEGREYLGCVNRIDGDGKVYMILID